MMIPLIISLSIEYVRESKKPFLLFLFLCVCIFLLFKRLLFWRKKAGEAFSVAAEHAPTENLRIRYARKGTLAGNKEARRHYIFLSPDSFSERHPLRPFKFKKTPCVFSGFYYPSRYWKWLSEKQLSFTKNVLDFKEGKMDGIEFFRDGIEQLKPTEGTVIMFMPCSAWWKYWIRFRQIADYIETQCPHLVNGFHYYKYLGERESLHLQKERSKATVEKNFEISQDLNGKNVIVVDDVITTGSSLKQFGKEIKSKGGHLVGAIFLASTFAMPDKITAYLTALSEELAASGKKDDDVSPKQDGQNAQTIQETHNSDEISTVQDCLETHRKPSATTGKLHKAKKRKGRSLLPDRTIICEDSGMLYCYGHYRPDKQPHYYYTVVHIPADEKKANVILSHLPEILEADRHREPTEYELSLNDYSKNGYGQ